MSHGGRHNPVQHVNNDHADDLLAAARAFGGHPDATAARAERIDREGVDVIVDTPRGPEEARLDFAESVTDGDSRALRAAFADLARRARTVLATEGNE
jgi:putative heme iron utilization protein